MGVRGGVPKKAHSGLKGQLQHEEAEGGDGTVLGERTQAPGKYRCFIGSEAGQGGA